MTIDQAREYVVIVNGGSGCIMQPMSDEYAYLLTAKHNIEKGYNTLKAITNFIYSEGKWSEKTIPIKKFESGSNYFPHPQKDIAIIKIPVQPHLTEAYRFDDINHDKSGYYLMGYPELRRKTHRTDRKQWYRRDQSVEIIDPRGAGMYEAKVPDNATLQEIMGQSGGCFCKVQDGKLFIAGIQNSMADANEQMGHVRFTDMASFDEIIALHTEVLVPLLPCHLKSFSFLWHEAFNLDAGLYNENIKFVKAFLKNKITEVIGDAATPSAIKKLFEHRLLLYSESTQTLQSKKIWIIWLEFLTILNLVKKQDYSEPGILELFNRIRLLCSDTDRDWGMELGNIIRADYKGLPKGSTVIIGTARPPAQNQFKLDRNIPLIDKAFRDHRSTINYNDLVIDEGITFPLYDYTFIHIAYFKDGAILNKNSEYAALMDDDHKILAKLQEEYKELLGK